MAKTDKKVSISSVDKVMHEIGVGTERVFDWNGLEITVKPLLSFYEVSAMIQEICDLCFSESGEFIPQAFNLAVGRGILARYANLRIPDDLEHMYKIIAGSGLVERVCEVVDEKQLKDIITSAKKKVEYMLHTSIAGVERKLDVLTDSIQALQESTKDLFADVSGDDIGKLMSAVEGTHMNQEKLMAAYFDEKRKREPEKQKTIAEVVRDGGAE